MKRTILALLMLIGSFGLISAGRSLAQTFTNLHNFTGGSDGARSESGLVLSGNILYGTTAQGGGAGNGTVFAVNTDGTGFTNLHSFTATFGSGPSGTAPYTNADGATPFTSLVLSGDTLYGVTSLGGLGGSGVVFAVRTNGTFFTNLHSFAAYSGPNFTNTEGGYPAGRLVLSGDLLFGTAYRGGVSGVGTLFCVKTDGTIFTNLHNFMSGTNNEGVAPLAGLILSGSTLFGTARDGGSSPNGTVFAVQTDGTGFTNLHKFTALQDGTNSDGAHPAAELLLSVNTLYGTASSGGGSSKGTVFKVNTDGTGFETLHSFTATSDGANPGALILSGGVLFGTASRGGNGGSGSMFAINTDGTGFRTLYSFTAMPAPYYNRNADGGYPNAGLVLSSNTLYATTYWGGSFSFGTVFGLFVPPQMTIFRSGTNVVLTWAPDAAVFKLQSTPTSTGTFTNIPGATSPYTNPISGAQQFFRLISN